MIQATLGLKDFKAIMIVRGYDRYFSDEGMEALYDYYSDESETKEAIISIDDIDFPDEWTEYKTLNCVLGEYNLDYKYQLEDLTDVVEILNETCGVMVKNI